jgi:hypothetical protein
MDVGLGEELDDPANPEWGQEVLPDQIRVRVVVYPIVGRCQEALVRVVGERKLLERDVAVPFVFAGEAGNRHGPVPSPPDRMEPGGLIADVSIHVGVDEVPARRGPLGEGRPEFPEVLRGVQTVDGRGL